MFEKVFKLSEHQTTVKTEVMAVFRLMLLPFLSSKFSIFVFL